MDAGYVSAETVVLLKLHRTVWTLERLVTDVLAQVVHHQMVVLSIARTQLAFEHFAA